MTMSKSELLHKYTDSRTPCLVYTRCMGYYRPTATFNYGKKAEFQQRVFFMVKHQNSSK